jgi:dCTP diphosphatase
MDTDIREQVRAFVAERDWEQFHSPRNLLLALVGEVGELAELIQWKSDQEVLGLLNSPEGREAFEQELADIAIYVTRLADVAEVDLDVAVLQKLEVNQKRYPVDRVKGKAVKHTELDDSS